MYAFDSIRRSGNEHESNRNQTTTFPAARRLPSYNQTGMTHKDDEDDEELADDAQCM